MILFLEYSSGGIRGGELYNSHIYEFLKSKYDVIPTNIPLSPPKLRNPISHYFNSLRIVKEKRPDLIVSDISSGIRNLGAIKWMRKSGRKSLLIIQEERMNFRWDTAIIRWIVRIIERSLVKNSNIFVVNSKYSSDLAVKKGAPTDACIIIVYPGMENFLSDYDKEYSKAITQEQMFNILYLGICKKHKGILYLVEAIRELKKDDIKLNIVGRFSEKEQYYRKIRKLITVNNLQDQITFHGFVGREKLDRLFRESVLYVHPSLMEGYGMALAEAMSYGLPIVSTTAGAIPELVKDGENGILVSPADSGELAIAINRLYFDSRLRNEIRMNNLEKARRLPGWIDFDKKLAQELVPIIKNIVGVERKKNNN